MSEPKTSKPLDKALGILLPGKPSEAAMRAARRIHKGYFGHAYDEPTKNDCECITADALAIDRETGLAEKEAALRMMIPILQWARKGICKALIPDTVDDAHLKDVKAALAAITAALAKGA